MARGKYAYGRCQRSGDRIPYRQLVSDGETPGLLVSPEWRDVKHPQESPVRATDDTHLNHPSPDTDVEATPSGQADNLAEALFPDGVYFGGQT